MPPAWHPPSPPAASVSTAQMLAGTVHVVSPGDDTRRSCDTAPDRGSALAPGSSSAAEIQRLEQGRERRGHTLERHGTGEQPRIADLVAAAPREEQGQLLLERAPALRPRCAGCRCSTLKECASP
jgi:hypothetical protein